jgi:hypothetical protein
MVPVYPPGVREVALELTVNVIVVGVVVAVPEVDDAVSQLGTKDSDQLTVPLVALS